MSGWLTERETCQHTLPSRKSNHMPHCPELEVSLMQWIRKCEEWKVPIVTGPTIRAKAEKIRDALRRQTHHDTSRLDAMEFSNGWLYRFQARNDLKSRRVYGEAASVSEQAVEDGKRCLHEVTRDYDKCNIFNMDETAYFYCTTHTKTICSARISGRKKIKKRITVAVTSNADGSSKWPLLFIGTAKQPRCFDGSSASDLGFEYTASGKGWMNSDVFAQWVERFNDTMLRENRQVLLLLDNASPHRYDGQLSNVSIHMLPPNTTAYLQPQDAGVIQAFKSKIGTLRAKHVVEKFEVLVDTCDESDKENFAALVSKLHDVTLLEALEWAKEAWQ
ncbi:hypothetical protein DYB35_013822, partial [Aphanomyces astaci]